MPKPRERVAAHEFSVTTSKHEADIRAAGERAIIAGKRTLSNTISVAGQSANRIDYVIKGPGNIVTQMAFSVRWTADGDPREVTLTVGDFMTGQQRIFLIPVAPKSIPALTSLQRFSAELRSQLSNN